MDMSRWTNNIGTMKKNDRKMMEEKSAEIETADKTMWRSLRREVFLSYGLWYLALSGMRWMSALIVSSSGGWLWSNNTSHYGASRLGKKGSRRSH